MPGAIDMALFEFSRGQSDIRCNPHNVVFAEVHEAFALTTFDTAGLARKTNRAISSLDQSNRETYSRP